MQNFDKAIEKYRRELIEFSKKNQIHTVPEMIEQVNEVEIADDEPIASITEEKIEEVENVVKEEAEPAMTTLVTTENPNQSRNYDEFLSQNSSKGQLKIQVTIAGAIPLPNANVSVSVELSDGERELYNGYTDINGIIDPINLPAPPVDLSYDENGTTVPYAVYTIRVTHPDFSPAEFRNAPVFDSIKSIQPVTLVPLTENGDKPGNTLISDQPMQLYGGEN